MIRRVLLLLFVLTSMSQAGAIDGVLYTSASGGDMGTQINNLVPQLPKFTTANGQSAMGVIRIPTGNYSYSTPIVINSPLVTIDCQGGTLTYAGNGIGMTFNDAPTSASGGGGLRNCWLFGNPSATVGIKNQEVTEFTLDHVRVGNFTNGVGVWFSNIQKWTERADFHHVLIDNNAVGFKGTDAGGTGSFSYTRWNDVLIAPYAGQTGLLLLNDTFFTGWMEMNFFLGQGATGIHLQNTSFIDHVYWYIRMELTGGTTAANGVVTDPGTRWRLTEDRWYYTAGITDNFAAGTRRSFIWCNSNTGDCAQSVASGLGITNNGPTGFLGTFSVSNITANRTWAMPDAGGTVLVTGNEKSPLQTKRVVPGCATAASIGATCTSKVTWATAFADTNYTLTGCMGNGVDSGVPVIQGITAKAAGSVTVQTAAMTAAAAQFTSIECAAVHD